MEAILYIFIGSALGLFLSCFLGAKKIADAEAGESYWRELYHLEKEKRNE